MIIEKPQQVPVYNDDVLHTGIKDSEYVPLYSAIPPVTKFYLDTFIRDILISTSYTKEQKINRINQHKDICKEYVFSGTVDFKIPSNISRNGDYWNGISYSFFRGNTNFSKIHIANVTMYVQYGYITMVDGSELQPLLCYMIKREYVPLFRSYLLLDIPLPDGIIECWMPKDLCTKDYANQTLRVALRTKIISKIPKEITIVKKTQQELNGMWFKFQEPTFNTIVERKTWLEQFGKAFVESEKKRLGVTDKPMFSFNSVRTGIATASSNDVAIGISNWVEEWVNSPDIESSAITSIATAGVRDRIAGYEDHVSTPLTQEDVQNIFDDLARSREDLSNTSYDSHPF